MELFSISLWTFLSFSTYRKPKNQNSPKITFAKERGRCSFYSSLAETFPSYAAVAFSGGSFLAWTRGRLGQVQYHLGAFLITDKEMFLEQPFSYSHPRKKQPLVRLSQTKLCNGVVLNEKSNLVETMRQLTSCLENCSTSRTNSFLFLPIVL